MYSIVIGCLEQVFSGGITVRVTGTVGLGWPSDAAIDDVTFR